MSNVEEVGFPVSGLSPVELGEFRAWFLKFHAEVWDQQFEEDVATSRLDVLPEEALAEPRAGRTRPV